MTADHKAVVTYQINAGSVSNHVKVTSITLGSAVKFTWTDGTPTHSASSNTGEATTGAGKGFTLTAPVTSATHVLYLCVGVSQGQGRFVVSSNGVTLFSDTSLSSKTKVKFGIYALTFSSAAPNQTLTLNWTLLSGNSHGGVIVIAAAATTPHRPVVHLPA